MRGLDLVGRSLVGAAAAGVVRLDAIAGAAVMRGHSTAQLYDTGELEDLLARMRRGEDVYAAFLERGFPPSWGEDTIEATVVRSPDADLLGLPDGGAGLRITRRTFSSDVAIGYSRSLYRGDAYDFAAELQIAAD